MEDGLRGGEFVEGYEAREGGVDGDDGRLKVAIGGVPDFPEFFKSRDCRPPLSASQKTAYVRSPQLDVRLSSGGFHSLPYILKRRKIPRFLAAHKHGEPVLSCRFASGLYERVPDFNSFFGLSQSKECPE